MYSKLSNLISKKKFFLFTLLFIGILISAFLEMIGVGSIPIFIGFLLNPDKILTYLPDNGFFSFIVQQSHFDQVLIVATILFTFFVFKNIFIFLTVCLQASLQKKLTIQNSKRLFSAYLISPYILHLNRNPAITTRNVQAEVASCTKHIDSMMIVTREILVLLVIFILLLLVEPVISLVVFSSISLVSLIFYFFVKNKMTNLTKKSLFHRARQIQLVNQVFGAIKDTKILAKEKFFTEEFNNETKGAENISFFSQIVVKSPRLLMEILAVSIILLITTLLINFENPIENLLPKLSFIGIAIIRMIPSFNSLTASITSMRRSIVSFNLVSSEIKEYEKYNDKKVDKKINNTDIKYFEKDEKIELQNINFKYPNTKKKVLSNINFDIRFGSSVGIIGPTGTGKSTLIDVILGLLEPSEGKVMINNQNIKDNYLAWQKQIGYIPQDIYLLDDTIRKNIAFGVSEKEISDKLLSDSVNLSQLNELITSLPKGLDTIVGNRGVKLSGGQKQRIGIARALYRKSKILVLDEATSSLDMITEKKLIEDIENLVGDYTLIIVTHRLSTIKNCDNVILLSQGKLLDQGKFEHLALKHKQLNINSIENNKTKFTQHD